MGRYMPRMVLMNIVIFVALFLVYFYTCLFAVKLYKYLIERLEAPQRKSILNLIIRYVLWLIFIVTVIPTSMFFPLWLNAKFTIIEQTQNATIGFIMLGNLVLVTIMWLGYKKKNNSFGENGI
jgi:hypothetical protein